MSNTIPIPPAALEAGARALWKGGHVMWRDSKDAARAAFEAMVEAWEGANTTERVLVDDYYEGILKTETFLTLPLPPPPAGETNE